MLVKSESASKLPIDNVGSSSHISSVNRNKSLTMYSFLVQEFNMGTRILARLYAGVCKANKRGRSGKQTSACCFVLCKVHT